jgi:hypothetical protein
MAHEIANRTESTKLISSKWSMITLPVPGISLARKTTELPPEAKHPSVHTMSLCRAAGGTFGEWQVGN